MKKILLVATLQSHIAQFHKPLIKMLQQLGCQVDVAARNNLAQKNNLTLTEANVIYDVPFDRSPYSLKNIRAYKTLKGIINSGEYDVIHCNTPVGGILTRLAARWCRKKGQCKVIYEAHGFHFFKGGSLINWVLWYPVECFFSRFTDILITINKMDYDLASKRFLKTSVKYIPGVGVNLEQFLRVESRANLKDEIGISKEDLIILSVGELNKNKNQQVIIKALSKISNEHVHYCLAGNGPRLKNLQKLSVKMGVKERVHFLGYRRDLVDIYKSADIFVLPSKREGLGMAAIEAMACGLPIVTSDRQGINDYSIDGLTGYKCSSNDVAGFAECIKKLIDNSTLRENMGRYNMQLSQKFNLSAAMEALMKVYSEII